MSCFSDNFLTADLTPEEKYWKQQQQFKIREFSKGFGKVKY